MNTKHPIPIDPTFAYVDASESQLQNLWRAWYPRGSGPLNAMRQICVLIESIAHMRGFDVSKWSIDTDMVN